MKRAIKIIMLLAFISTSKAQTIKVTYAEKLDISDKLKSIHNPIIKKMILKKSGQPKYYELISDNGISIYKKVDKENDGDSDVVIENDTDNDIIYKNHKENQYIKHTEFMSRNFLIEDKLEKFDWKITNDTMKIGKYLCKKAVLNQGKNKITAWFTTEIPVNEGPRDYYGLPGLILKVETNVYVIEAQEINISKEKVEIKKPTKGKKVTREEFNKIKAEKTNNSSNDKQKDVEIQVIKM